MEKTFFLYGELLNSTSKMTADFLEQNKNAAVTIRINSEGGNIFSGLAINSLLKSHGNATVIIDGICGSAATLAAVGAKNVKAVKNSFFVIHNPLVELWDSYTAEELNQLKNSLDALKNSVISTYQAKVNLDTAKLSEMMDKEDWLTAEDAKNLGFIDEILDEDAEIKIDNSAKIMFVNRLAVDCSKFKNLPQEKREAKTVDKENSILMEKYKNSILADERGRVAALNAMKNDSPAVNAIINKAIETGDSVDKVKPFIDAVKNVVPVEKKDSTKENLNQYLNLLKDNVNSGAENVEGSTPPPSKDEKDKAQAELIAKFTNKILSKAV